MLLYSLVAWPSSTFTFISNFLWRVFQLIFLILIFYLYILETINFSLLSRFFFCCHRWSTRFSWKTFYFTTYLGFPVYSHQEDEIDRYIYTYIDRYIENERTKAIKRIYFSYLSSKREESKYPDVVTDIHRHKTFPGIWCLSENKRLNRTLGQIYHATPPNTCAPFSCLFR